MQLDLTEGFFDPKQRPRPRRRGRDGARKARPFAPRAEPLEVRITPTGNLAITAITAVDSSDKPLATINVGESVFIQVDYTTMDLPADASYRVGFTVNGLTLDTGQVSHGAGASGSGSWVLYWGSWNATPGTNQVIVTVDPDRSVAETSYADNAMGATFNAVSPSVGSVSYSVAQVREAYGLDKLPNFGSTPADGSGQTIVLDEAANDPTIITDLEGFDRAMSLTTTSTATLSQAYGPASSFVKVYNQQGKDITADIGTSGTNGVPPVDPTGHWAGEETLDVEWAHAMAPGAKIDIIEVPDDANWALNLLAGDKLAASLPGVSAISNSFGLTEWAGETAYDSSTFATPSGHPGVTFLTASNDNGANVYPSPPVSPPPSVGNDGYYPATSPNVLSVGGTELTLAGNGYGGETSWSFPTPTSLVDNGGASYTQSGPWAAQSGGFSGGYSTASGGAASSAAWTVPITPSDTGFGTEVSATWTAAAGNATNAKYTIYDGTRAAGTILGTVSLDQTKGPIGTAVGGSKFQELGVFFPTLDAGGNGTLTVVLDASTANGKVVADAIGGADGWASTGGPSRFEPEPSYQLASQATGFRTTPDVAFVGSQYSGVTTYQAGNLGYGGFGTSLGSPCWAGLIAIVNQGRVAAGGTPLNGPGSPTQALQALYSLPGGDYHDITTGYNGFNAGAGYDDLTGRGSPIVNLLIPDLVAFGMAEQLAVSTQPPAGVTAGAGFGLVVTAKDLSGNTATGYNGVVTIALANNPGGGSLIGSTTATAVNGVATFAGLTLDVAGMGYTIRATAAGLAGATTSPLDVGAGAAYVRVVSAQPPATVTAGAGFGLGVTVEDAFGNVVANYAGSFTVSLANNPGGSVLGGTLTAATSGGVATFSGLTLNKAGAGYTLAVSTAGLAARAPTPLAVVPAPASQLVIAQEPNPGVVAGLGFGLVVAVEDPFGNVETGDNATAVTASLKLGAGPLLGPATVTASGGLATFANLADDRAEVITLDLGGGALAHATSSTVVVAPAAAAKLVVQGQPSPAAFVGQPFPSQPVIDEEDQFGNIEALDSTTAVTASPAPGAGPLQGATMAIVSRGVATFANLADKKAETLTLQFAAGTLAMATSTPIVVGKATPTIAWPAPPTIPYGTPLGAAQLDATAGNAGATVPGTFAYAPGSGAVLAAGPRVLSVTFTPTDPADYTAATATFTIDVQVATTTTLSSPVTSVASKHSITFTAAVSAPAGGPTPTGSVTFLDGSTVLGSSTLDAAGHAAFSTAGLASGTRSITARYAGDPSNASSTSRPTSLVVRAPAGGDFDGDGKADVAIYDQTASVFYIAYSGNGTTRVQPFGNPAHHNIPIAGDFDGDGKTDLAIYDQTAGVFYVLESGGGSIIRPFGDSTHLNVPIAGDFDGDGRTDVAIFDQTASTFYVLETGGGSIVRPFGNSAHLNIPLAGDFDGDGRTDVAIYDQTASVFYIAYSGNGTTRVQPFGNSMHLNVPVASDFDGDGKTDIAIFDQTASAFFVLESGGGSLIQPFGNGADVNVPVVGDFNGDGKADLAIYDQTAGVFYVLESDGVGLIQPFGNRKHANIPV